MLEVLRAELEFLQMGGYRHTNRAAWSPEFLFQDSPTCLNVDPTQPHRPCSDCVMTQLIPLNERGETLDSLYRSGGREEIETAVAERLKKTITGLELEREGWAKAYDLPEVHVQAKFVNGI